MNIQTQSDFISQWIRDDQQEIVEVRSSIQVANLDADQSAMSRKTPRMEHWQADLLALEQGLEGLRLKQDSLQDRFGVLPGLCG